MIEGGRQQRLRFELLLRVSNQHPANRHRRFAGVIPNRRIRGHFDFTWPFPIPLIDRERGPLGVVIGQHRLQSGTALAFEPRTSPGAGFTRGRRVIQSRVETQARDQAGLGQALHLS